MLRASVDAQRVAARNARLAHSARHDGGVRRRAAFCGEDAFGRDHAVHVVRRGLVAHEDRLASKLLPRDGVVRREHGLARGRAGRRVEPLAHGAGLLVRIDARVKELIERLRVDHSDGAALIDHALGHEIERDLHGGLGGALRVARLQHEELAALHGKLEVLHVAIVTLQALCDLLELRVYLRLPAREIGDLLGRADPGDDVLALCVVEVFAEQRALAGVGIAREGDAGSGILAHVSEHHLHHRHGGAPVVRDAVEAPVVHGALGVPRVEHCNDRASAAGRGRPAETPCQCVRKRSL